MITMAIIKLKDLRKMDAKELDKKLNELRLEMAKEKANISIGASTISPGKMREIKRTIARIQTIKKSIKEAGKGE
jgi:large subunit ribosomal protein L29